MRFQPLSKLKVDMFNTSSGSPDRLAAAAHSTEAKRRNETGT